VRRLGLALVLLAVAAGCGDEQPRGVEVTEADDDVFAGPARPSMAFDTVYADSGLYADPRLRPDSLRADSLRRDSLRQDSLRRAEVVRPDFRTFWPRFQAAVRQGPDAVRPLTAFSERLGEPAFELLYDVAFGGEPYRSRVLALTPRDFALEGASREATILIGYDADGQIVPQDEADTESSVSIRFEVVGGAYRLGEINPAG